MVNKPLPGVGVLEYIMFAADRMSEKWTVGREAKLREQLWNFEDNLSAKNIIPFNIPACQEGVYVVYSFYNPPLESLLQIKFVWTQPAGLSSSLPG